MNRPYRPEVPPPRIFEIRKKILGLMKEARDQKNLPQQRFVALFQAFVLQGMYNLRPSGRRQLAYCADIYELGHGGAHALLAEELPPQEFGNVCAMVSRRKKKAEEKRAAVRASDTRPDSWKGKSPVKTEGDGCGH